MLTIFTIYSIAYFSFFNAGAQTDKTIENPLEKMSEEEKEQEAEKLVTLFEKLNEKGVVKPVGIGRDGKPKEIVGAADET